MTVETVKVRSDGVVFIGEMKVGRVFKLGGWWQASADLEAGGEPIKHNGACAWLLKRLAVDSLLAWLKDQNT